MRRLIIFIAILGFIGQAQSQLPTFHQFYGRAYCNDGSLVPDGATILAKIDGREFTTIVKEGRYGHDSLFFVENAENGEIIHFYVGDELIAEHTFQNERATKLSIYVDCAKIPGEKGTKLFIRAPDEIMDGEYFSVFIIDEKNNPVFAANVTYMEQVRLSQVNGVVTFRADFRHLLITAKKLGYEGTYKELDIITSEHSSSEGDELDYEFLNLLVLLVSFLVLLTLIWTMLKRFSKIEE